VLVLHEQVPDYAAYGAAAVRQILLYSSQSQAGWPGAPSRNWVAAFWPLVNRRSRWSLRAGGDTKTKRSRRTHALPQRCVDALREHRTRQDGLKRQADSRW